MNSSPYPRSPARRRLRARRCARAATAATTAAASGSDTFLFAPEPALAPIPEPTPMPGGPTAQGGTNPTPPPTGVPGVDAVTVLTVDAGEGAAVVPGAPPEAPTATGLLVAAGRLDVWGVGTGDTPGAGATSGWIPPSPPRPATPPTAPADTTSG